MLEKIVFGLIGAIFFMSFITYVVLAARVSNRIKKKKENLEKGALKVLFAYSKQEKKSFSIALVMMVFAIACQLISPIFLL